MPVGNHQSVLVVNGDQRARAERNATSARCDDAADGRVDVLRLAGPSRLKIGGLSTSTKKRRTRDWSCITTDTGKQCQTNAYNLNGEQTQTVHFVADRWYRWASFL